MKLRDPNTVALVVSIASSVIVLLIFSAGLLRARTEDLQQATTRLHHFSMMMAEHTARSLGSVDILLRELSGDLAHTANAWGNLDDVRGWELLAARHSKSLPQLRDLILFDATGRQRFVSTIFPTPPLNVSDRPYFTALQQGTVAVTFGPFVGRNTGRYTFALARRVETPDRKFGGVIFAAIELGYFQDFCWPLRLHDDFDAYLVTEAGKVVSSCRPADLSRQSIIIGQPIARVLGHSEFLAIPGNSQDSDHLFSVVSLPANGDLRIVTIMPMRAALVGWNQKLLEVGIFALLIVAVTLSGGWLLRRQFIELARTSTELKASQENLEERIRDATTELARQKDEAEHANLAKSRFLAAASHDLRQPLHALGLFTADLQRQISSGYTRDLDQVAAQINSSVVSLSDMLDALLDLSRLDVGGVKPDPQIFAVQTLFDRLQLAFRRAAISKSLTLRLRPSGFHIDSDIQLAERLLSNLVSNAIRYTPEGGRVLVAARRRGDSVRIEVRDNGIGIAPEHQRMIFKEFFQVANPARDQKQGLGLGLSIVQRLARTLGTPLDFRSQLKRGTRFAITLPLASGRAIPDEVPSTLPAVWLIGNNADFPRIADLMNGWGYPCRTLPDINVLIGTANAPGIIITEPDQATTIRYRLSHRWPVVLLGGDAETATRGMHAIAPGIRPARLRALLQQLQNTLSKSI